MNPLTNTPFWIISYKCKRRFGKLILFIERARQHHRSIMLREYMEQNKEVLKVIYFPEGSSEFNAIEECWRQGKYAAGIEILSEICKFQRYYSQLL